MIAIQDSSGNYQSIRVMVDSASESNFISEKSLHRCGISRTNFSISIVGLNQTASNISKQFNQTPFVGSLYHFFR